MPTGLVTVRNVQTHIISTIPVNRLIESLENVPDGVRKAAAGLKYNSLTTVLCSRSKVAGLSWLYLPSLL